MLRNETPRAGFDRTSSYIITVQKILIYLLIDVRTIKFNLNLNKYNFKLMFPEGVFNFINSFISQDFLSLEHFRGTNILASFHKVGTRL